MRFLAILGLSACAMTAASLQNDGPTEFGRVTWQRDHDAAFAAAKSADKPVFLLFQEVPG